MQDFSEEQIMEIVAHWIRNKKKEKSGQKSMLQLKKKKMKKLVFNEITWVN
ncbi:hypothetical protein [Acetomicrobium hydrogeniformans]|uniref:Uncharacterized protein n=1 Tax=Acetomicrobium hydrogeniformans ATCC BAA-1850 TaxID=592015 RepID=A0A0T5XCI4_9BACT|nr:hypothetical protein [Acetomicrobium hydrogeniformans]KRT36076.1 hypothetical protein HMPREF1705_03337 [Acetomicrobium hydrogeniformans ATCC BAA-1850]